jgi:hypothetical protein
MWKFPEIWLIPVCNTFTNSLALYLLLLRRHLTEWWRGPQSCNVSLLYRIHALQIALKAKSFTSD